MTRRPYNTDHTIGENNIAFLGLDVHNPVFFVAAALVLTFIGLTLVYPDVASAGLFATRDWVLGTFDWLFVASVNVMLLFCAFLVLTPLGGLRIGGQNARPEFSRWSWFAMLFSAGVGIGLMFWGAA